MVYTDITKLFVACTYKTTPVRALTCFTCTKILEEVSQRFSRLATPQKISLSFCKTAKRQILIQHSEQFPQPVFCGHWIRSPKLFLKGRPTLSKVNLVHVLSNVIGTKASSQFQCCRFSNSQSCGHPQVRNNPPFHTRDHLNFTSQKV